MPATSAICLLASEVEPLSKTGGLADVAGALTKYLHGAGHDVRTFTPCYASIDRAACKAQPVAGVSQVCRSASARMRTCSRCCAPSCRAGRRCT